jgi:mono/diheme cytochrome c family protein/uncharacterized membrane protein
MMNCRNRMRTPRFGLEILVATFFFFEFTSPAQQLPKEQTGQEPAKNSKASSLYSKHCHKCHGQDGTGADGRRNFPEIPDFTSEKWQKRRSDAELVTSILDGKGDSMPQFATKLSNEEVKALVAFIRSFARQEKPTSETERDYDKKFGELSEQLKELRKQFREMLETSASAQPAALAAPTGVTKEVPSMKERRAASGLFGQHCEECHGAEGKGTPVRKRLPRIPDFTDTHWQRQRTDAHLLASVLDGKRTEMPAFRAKISEEQARELVAQVRRFGTSHRGPGDNGACKAAEKGRSQEPSGEAVKAEEEKTLPQQSFSRQIMGWLGRFHPSIVHFPIGLLLAAAVAELLFLGTGRDLFDSAARVCVWFGGLAAAPAATFGWFLAGARLSDPNWVLTVHRWLGTSTAACAVVVLCLCEMSRRARSPPRRAFRLALLLSALVVLLTGFFGGALIHGLNYYAWPPQTTAPGVPSTQ